MTVGGRGAQTLMRSMSMEINTVNLAGKNKTITRETIGSFSKGEIRVSGNVSSVATFILIGVLVR